MRFQTLFSLALVAVIAACGPSERKPAYSLKIEKRDASNAGSVAQMTFGEVLNVAKNSNRMSCLELTFAELQANVLKLAGGSAVATTDPTVKLLAATIGPVASDRLRAEQTCHCDSINPMAGYELYERRTHLFRRNNAASTSPEFAGLYPLDEAGAPRFLNAGEPIEDEVLAQLPPVPRAPEYDDCGSSCKAARKRVNAKAVEEGKPEPWPNLQRPAKQQCTPAQKAAIANG